jgi:hypothetical protein
MSASWRPGESETVSLLRAESAVLAAVAGGAMLRGTPAELMDRLGIGPPIFRAAVHDLVAGGWIFATPASDGLLTIGRVCRTRDDGPPGAVERRQPATRCQFSQWETTRASLAI